jgi:hypothetical protein
MKDREWCKRIEDEITGLKERVRKLKGNAGWRGPNQKIIELDIEWPEANIGGLHFNTQKTHGVFELKEDGNYYSRDILIHSARDTDDGTSRDLLTEYLESGEVKAAFLDALDVVETCIAQPGAIRVFIPKENAGVKKYNGAGGWYWLADRCSGFAANFCIVGNYGGAYNNFASAVGGCAPAFCAGDNRRG